MIAAILIASYAVIFTHLGIARYQSTFSYDWRDEAVDNQMMYNTARGDILLSTIKGEHRHHRHFRPIFLAASLPYLVVHDARAWYALVALALALGGIAGYRLGSRLLGGPWRGVLACAAWLAWPALHEITLGNLDPETLVAAVWLFAAMFYVENRIVGFTVAAILAVCCKETQAPVLAAFGFVALMQRRGARWWAAPILLGAAWFVLAIKVVIPSYHPTFDTIYNRFIGVEGASFPASFLLALMQDARGTLAAVFSREHLTLFVRMLQPLGFLSVISPLPLLASGSIVAQILLLKDPLPVRQAHIVSAILPFAFWAMLDGLRRIGDIAARRREIGKKGAYRLQTVLLASVIASCVYFIFQDGLFGRYQSFGREPVGIMNVSRVLDPAFFSPTAAERRVADAISHIEPEVDAAANSRLLLLMSNRARLVEFGTQSSPAELGGVRVIALWFLEAKCPTCTFNELSPQNLRMAARLIESGDFQVAVLDPAFAVLASTSKPPKNLSPDPLLSAPFLARVEELARRLERAEGLPFDEPRRSGVQRSGPLSTD